MTSLSYLKMQIDYSCTHSSNNSGLSSDTVPFLQFYKAACKLKFLHQVILTAYFLLKFYMYINK